MRTVKKVKSYISLLLIVLLIFSNFPFEVAEAETVAALSDFITGGNIAQGAKGVDYTTTTITINFDASYKLRTQESLNNIRVIVANEYDETDKFNISVQNNVITLTLKEAPPDQTHLHPLQLRKHALYNIYIPQGTFIHTDGVNINPTVHYTFVTKAEDTAEYKEDLLVQTYPSNYQNQVDDYRKTIEFEFVDDIAVDTEVLNNITDYIKISTDPIDPDIPGYGTGSDTIDNYDVKVQDNRLILESKSGKLRDFANYTVKLRDGTVHLKNSSQHKIYNQAENNIETADGDNWEVIMFTTDDMLVTDKNQVRTSPVNNEENVEVEPTIEFHFKYPIEILDKTKIQLTSDADTFAVDIQSDVAVDDKTLKITVNDLEDQGQSTIYPLRRNTVYRITLAPGAVQFKDYTNESTNDSIKNREINLYFITRGEGDAPVVTWYSSNVYKSDDITILEKTNLASDGSIYIHFDRPIKWDKQSKFLSPVEATKLYKIPKAYMTKYDETGRIYDKKLVFKPSADKTKILPDAITDPEEPEKIEEIGIDTDELIIDKVEIVENYPNIIRITPRYPLINLNKYRLTMDRRIIEDLNDYNLEKDIDFTFWTKKGNSTVRPNWQINNIPAGAIKENKDAPYKSYTLFGVPSYEPSNPVTLYIDQEVIPRAEDEVIQEEPEKIKSITFNALKDISLVDAIYHDDVGVREIELAEYEFDYYFENGIKKTKLLLYPSTKLEKGTYYRLKIPGNVLETRDGIFLEPLELNFVIEGDKTQPKGIYSITPNEFKVTDFYWGNSTFLIKGFNFNESVESITLTRVSDSLNIVIQKEDIYFKDVTQILVKVRGDAAATLSKETSVGEYRVMLHFNDGSGIYEDVTWSGGTIQVLSKDRPTVKAKYPDSGNVWYDEKSLPTKVVNGTTKYFMKITFYDIDGNLALNDFNAIRNSTVYAQGSGVNLLDTDCLNDISGLSNRNDYVFEKNRQAREAYLYIPIKPLRTNTTYDVTISPDIVHFADIISSGSGNLAISWSFTTMAVPAVKDVLIGTVVEDYDEDQPIILTGDLFYSDTVTVYFNGIEADRVWVRENPATKEKYLEVYLPDGSNRLKPGLYNVIVQNDDNHQRMLYGAFSVVREGENIPNEEYRIKEKEREGEIRSKIKVSEDTLMLKSTYTNDTKLEFDLDELMGEDVLIRKIQYRGSNRDRIEELITQSKWADIALYDVTLDPAADSRDIIIRLGRVEPGVAQVLKTKLRRKAVKSEFIQVTGEAFKLSSIALTIPFKNSDGENIKVLRYDEETRNFYEEGFSVNFIDRTVKVTSKRPGIFLVVE
ncbi:MAG: hypothetical protein PWP27_1783 [Clostridiales bacterium]|nr:hypothetical protein [Clostridiales bacterium]MDK2933973.1 hypothetical protein [Clostridiales bacterium]